IGQLNATPGEMSMIRTAGIWSMMILCGLVNFVGALMTLSILGTNRFGNYEYYGDRVALYLGPALIGFLVPGMVGRFLDKRRALRFPFLLGLMLVCGFVMAFMWAFILHRWPL
ncbi:MAG: hypothetical protein ACYC6N_24220, partial [Pirellulaceae bacterium]